MALATSDEVYERVVKSLPAHEQLRLVEKIVHDLAATATDPTAIKTADEAAPGHDWMVLRGIAPNLLDGEDAQAWVSRTRQESDEARNAPGSPTP
ncbi:MAG: hypothetical protein M3347_03470 [Armatimonadota bacterium]|nr:hypothetical protein [Armatimonadota bacterium]